MATTGFITKEGEFNAIFCYPLVNEFIDASVNTNYNNKIFKNPLSIEIKVPDIEWKTTGQNVRPQTKSLNLNSMVKTHKCHDLLSCNSCGRCRKC